MAIHDSDKSSADRSSPQLSNHDIRSGTRSAHNTTSVNYANTTDDLPDSNKNIKMPLGGLIAKDTVELDFGSAAVSTIRVPHELTFVPDVRVAMNDTTNSDISTGPVTVFLPTYLDANISGGAVTFQTFLYCMADEDWLYFQLLNATGSDRTATVTYYLYLQPVQHVAVT